MDVRYIITRNAWGDGMKAESSIVPELIAPFEQLKVKCREIGVEFITLPEWKEGMEVVCALFIDCPAADDPLVKMWVHRNIPEMFLMITENLYLQPNHTYAAIGKFANRIFSYELNPMFPETTTRLRYPVAIQEGLALRQKALQGERPYFAGAIVSLKQSDMPGSLYAKRAEIAFQWSLALGEKFALWGNGWTAGGFGESARGYLPTGLTAKHDALSKCEFAVCLENNNSIPGYVTEKLFNALIAGCIPIYEGDTGDIHPYSYINAGKFKHAIELLNHVESMGQNEKDCMRAYGRDFLEQADVFSDSNYINTLFEAIEEIL